MASSKLTIPIRNMMVAVLGSVTSLRIGSLINQEAVTVYLSSLVASFVEMFRFSSVIQPIAISIAIVGVFLLLYKRVQRFFTLIVGLNALLSIGIWTSVIMVPLTEYNEQPVWLVLIIMINLLISVLLISLVPALVGLFLHDILRPE